MARLLLVWLSGLLLLGAPTGPRQVKESEIRFAVVNAGFTVEGTLAGLEATVQFDPAHLDQARIRASVPVATIHTGIALRDKHLQKPDWFDAAQYPAIALQSTAFRQTGPGHYEGVFALTMKGVQREVKLPFTVSAAHEFQGQLRINRLDFNLGKKSLILSDEVLVTIRLKLAKDS